MSNRDACRDCRQTGLWVTMTYGKVRMLEAQPHPGGNVMVYMSNEVDDKGHRIRIASKLDDDVARLARRAGLPLYRFHLDHCPKSRRNELAHR